MIYIQHTDRTSFYWVMYNKEQHIIIKIRFNEEKIDSWVILAVCKKNLQRFCNDMINTSGTVDNNLGQDR